MNQTDPPPRPTDAELSILRVLWKKSPASVREVLERLNATRKEPLGYTTVLKFLQIMTEKGLVCRDADERAHQYRPAVAPEKTKRLMVSDLLDRVFEGSAVDLVMQALGSRKVSAAELAEIRRLLDEKGGAQ